MHICLRPFSSGFVTSRGTKCDSPNVASRGRVTSTFASEERKENCDLRRKEVIQSEAVRHLEKCGRRTGSITELKGNSEKRFSLLFPRETALATTPSLMDLVHFRNRRLLSTDDPTAMTILKMHNYFLITLACCHAHKRQTSKKFTMEILIRMVNRYSKEISFVSL